MGPYLPIQYKCHFLQFSTFCFLLSYQLYYHEKILLTTKIKSGILVIEQKNCSPAGLGIKKYINLNRKKDRFQKTTTNSCSMWNSLCPLPFVCEIHKLNEKKKQKRKTKKRYHPHPCFKTKNKTHSS